MKALPRILCVDDEESVLNGLRRVLSDYFEIHTATGGVEALRQMAEYEFSVIVCDMRMPELDGAQLLAKVHAQWPNTTRILLTGYADMDLAVAAVNEGNIFRFLLKPCPGEDLMRHIYDGVRLHQLIHAEKELLEKTLKGAIKVLVETLSTVAPNAFNRTLKIKRLVTHMATVAKKKNVWEYEIAAMLSQVGAIVLPPELLNKGYSAIHLDQDETKMLSTIPAVGAKLVGGIPRLENVALMIKHQFNDDLVAVAALTDGVAFGATLLRLATVVDRIMLRESIDLSKAILVVTELYPDVNDVQLLESLSNLKLGQTEQVLKEVKLSELNPGMVLNKSVHTLGGSVVLSKDQELTAELINRLHNFSKHSGIQEPIEVLGTF